MEEVKRCCFIHKTYFFLFQEKVIWTFSIGCIARKTLFNKFLLPVLTVCFSQLNKNDYSLYVCEIKYTNYIYRFD